MTDRTDELTVHDDYDLAAALAIAMRGARSTGDVQWERTLAATLAQVTRTLVLAADPDE